MPSSLSLALAKNIIEAARGDEKQLLERIAAALDEANRNPIGLPSDLAPASAPER